MSVAFELFIQVIQVRVISASVSQLSLINCLNKKSQSESSERNLCIAETSKIQN